MSPLLETALAVREEKQDFPSLLQEIFAGRYTGMVILHCIEGVPKTVEFPARRIRLTSQQNSRTLSSET